MLDRVLRGDDEKRLRQRERFTVDGDLRFVHGFEKRGLRARRGAIDFVGEDDIGEDRAGTKFKIARLGIVDADAGNVFDEQVAAREQRDEGELDGVFLAVDGARDGALKLRDDWGGGGGHWLKTCVLPATNR